MNRRGFIKAIFAGAATIALPVSAIQAVAPGLFVLSGDGITDDTLALQALINGESVILRDGSVLRGSIDGSGVFVVRLPEGRYSLAAGSRIMGRQGLIPTCVELAP